MESQADSKPVTAVISDPELLTLIDISGIKVEKTSPLSHAKGKPSSEEASSATDRLMQLGLLEAPDRLDIQCLKALEILANPDSETRLLWGDSDRVNLSAVYSTKDSGSGNLVSFTRLESSKNHLSYFISFKEILGLMDERVASHELKGGPGLSLETKPEAMAVLFASLDLHREAQLRALLEKRQEFEVDASQKDIMRILMEANAKPALQWYAPIGNMIMPVEFELNEASVTEGIRALKQEGAIKEDNGTNGLSSSLTTFAQMAFPIMGYCGVKISVSTGSALEGAQLGLIRGVASLLLLQLSSDEKISINSISTSEVPGILFNIATRPFESLATAKKETCVKCGAENKAGAKFCTKCGAELEVPSTNKVCPNCGEPVKENVSYCRKCGEKLT